MDVTVRKAVGHFPEEPFQKVVVVSVGWVDGAKRSVRIRTRVALRQEAGLTGAPRAGVTYLGKTQDTHHKTYARMIKKILFKL